MPIPQCYIPCRRAVFSSRLDVRPRSKKKLRHQWMSFKSGHVEGGEVVFAPPIDLGAGADEQLDRSRVALPGGDVQGS